MTWRVFAETSGRSWQERFGTAAKRAGADGLIVSGVIFFAPSGIRMRRGGGVASATAELVSLADSTVMAKVAVSYQSLGAAIENAASALAEAIQEKILRP